MQFISIGVEHSHLARWTPTDDLYRTRSARSTRVGKRAADQHPLWHQRESDNAPKTTRVQYRTMLTDKISAIREWGNGANVCVGRLAMR
jgi:hypothetical protein